MKNEEILKKAIEKAVKNGFKKEDGEFHHYEIIFSHDFAKAFWGVSPHIYLNIDGVSHTSNYKLERWQYYLQQMVLEEDPIKYLEQFI